MANMCYFMMKIVGTEKNANEMFDVIKNNYGIDVREYNRDVDPDADKVYIFLDGDCKWSVKSSMLDVEPSILSHASSLNVTMEIFSSEPGCCFQEHFVIENGEISVNECVDFYEFDDVESFESEGGLEEFNKEHGTEFTSYKVVDDFVQIGGFDDFGCF